MILEDDPCDVVAKCLDGMGLGRTEFAERVQRPVEELDALIDGNQIPPTIETWCDALPISAAALLGMSRYPAASPLPASVALITTPFGHLGVNSWWLADHGVLIDAGTDGESVVEQLKQLNATPRELWVTHGHQDHVAGIASIRSAFPDLLVCGPASLPEVQVLEPGSHRNDVEILALDGHWPGAIGFLGAGWFACGDAIFAGSIGKIPESGWADGLARLENCVRELSGDTLVLPGHGPHSSIAIERSHSPFFRAT